MPKGTLPFSIYPLAVSISTAMVDFGMKNVYSTCGNGIDTACLETKTDQPSFWYTDGEKRYPRLKFKAQPGKPEAVVAQENNVWRVYGATNNRFVLEL